MRTRLDATQINDRGCGGLFQVARTLLFAQMLTGAVVIGTPINTDAAEIEITSVPPWEAGGTVTGRVSGMGIDFSAYQVAAYLQVEGLGWYTKPNQATRTVAILQDGSFSVPIGVDGLDEFATIYTTHVVPIGSIPPLVLGGHRVPENPLSIASASRHRYGRTINWENREWAVKEAPLPVSPGDSFPDRNGRNRFSADPQDVFVDAEGNLHLTVNFRDGHWQATEVFLTDQDSLGYGTYVTQTNASVARLDSYITFSPYIYDSYGDESNGADPNREIDIEYSRWGMPNDPTNGQFVVHPHEQPGNLQRFTVPDSVQNDETLTHIFTWQEGRLDFRVLRGDKSPFGYAPGDVLAEHTYLHDPAAGHFVPTEGRETFHLNLWPNNVQVGLPAPPSPSNDQPVDIAIKSFDFFELVHTVPRLAQDRLIINHGQTIVLETNSGTSVVGALSIAGGTMPTATLDLKNNGFVINYTGASPIPTIRAQLLAGRGGSGLGKTWNGPGITSSAAAADNAAEPESRSIGYAENSALPLGMYDEFRGQPVDDTSVLMAYTRTADANLDGVVNDDDVTIVGATYAPGVPNPHWALGDFDYNGFVDDDDVTLLGAFYDPSAAPLITPAPAGATGVAAVPEPGTVALLLGALGVVLIAGLHAARRRRRAFLLSAHCHGECRAM